MSEFDVWFDAQMWMDIEGKCDVMQAWDYQQKRIAELEVHKRYLKNIQDELVKDRDKLEVERNKALDRNAALLSENSQMILELQALREAVLDLPVDEMTYEQDEELVLAGYCMQAQGEWDRVRALLEVQDEL